MKPAFIRKAADLSEVLDQWCGLKFTFEVESTLHEDDFDEKIDSLYLVETDSGEKLKVWEGTYYG
jgi:hypothetical protein